jgi:hypothetical protein
MQELTWEKLRMVILQIPTVFWIGGKITLSAIECRWARDVR